MASNDPVSQNAGLTHLGSPKMLLGQRGGPLFGEKFASSHCSAA